jgi:hypothetical protein
MTLGGIFDLRFARGNFDRYLRMLGTPVGGRMQTFIEEGQDLGICHTVDFQAHRQMRGRNGRIGTWSLDAGHGTLEC